MVELGVPGLDYGEALLPLDCLVYSVHCTVSTSDIHVHWASKETCHFFRARLTLIQSIKMNHIWTQIHYSYPYQAHLKKHRFAWVKKEKNVVKSQEVIFTKSLKLLASRAGSLPQTKTSTAFAFITHHWNWMNLVKMSCLLNDYTVGLHH